MKQILILTAFIVSIFSFTNEVKAQDNGGNIELSGSIGPAFGADKVKFYGNFELNYFMASNMTLMGGYEYLNNGGNMILGSRVYVVPNLHFSMKGVLINTTDFALGGGYSRYIDNNLSLQINGDYYFARNLFALSFGLGIRI
ncbi:hypothetical protein KMW28_12465 [Flammeovirga yaeyamensis]|uniref:Outer membrane protein beta-barrel domain-containing protein n=1 Tax=Flammeovirga yaeyamensis TaxID=367791 RepID=A0AAX1MZF7_9BACT|nr:MULTISPECIES: hypothetical protein [Flammeovirga]ANQ48097.1 hypothetical protein MY04_0715 [Flammeovirga sp. MY04]MBB3696018.1 hypothetical protein [Flammeovirga yaeyamensis]NMF34704.1 hypothetical protein [Flammeovirga yaeyamensis]QWG00467.1 hypothetical protein KMW28_12465 [Flammeovirga yaeyamensis]